MPFQSAPEVAGEGIVAGLARWAPTVVLRLLAVVFLGAVLLYFVRPVVLQFLARPVEERGRMASVPETAAARLTQENLALTQQNPERAAQLVRQWLQENPPVRSA